MESLARFDFHVQVGDRHQVLLFCVPKAASTQLLQLIRRMAGFRDWREDPHHLDRPFATDRAPAAIRAMLLEPSWRRVVVLRDPAERLLSAYLDKFTRMPNHVANAFGHPGFGMAFEDFLGFVLDGNQDPAHPTGLHERTEPHWRPQTLIGGIGHHREQLTDAIDFAEVGPGIRRVLEQLGAWDRYGASGWGPDRTGALFGVNDSHRRTGAAKRMSEFYDADTLESVYTAYAVDLELGRSLGLDLRHH